jgi:hypothetical protein
MAVFLVSGCKSFIDTRRYKTNKRVDNNKLTVIVISARGFSVPIETGIEQTKKKIVPWSRLSFWFGGDWFGILTLLVRYKYWILYFKMQGL